MLFFSPHSAPSCAERKHGRCTWCGKSHHHPRRTLYTNTMLSLCAIASMVESGLHAIPVTMYVLAPCESWLEACTAASPCTCRYCSLTFSAGFVEKRSLRSPASSYTCTTRSAVTTASFWLLGENTTDDTVAMPSLGSCSVFRCVNFILKQHQHKGSQPARLNHTCCPLDQLARGTVCDPWPAACAIAVWCARPRYTVSDGDTVLLYEYQGLCQENSP